MSNNEMETDDYLVSDAELVGRESKWLGFFKKVKENEDDDDLGVPLDSLMDAYSNCNSDDESDNESVKSTEFVEKQTRKPPEDDHFDVKLAATNAQSAVNKRVENWLSKGFKDKQNQIRDPSYTAETAPHNHRDSWLTKSLLPSFIKTASSSSAIQKSSMSVVKKQEVSTSSIRNRVESIRSETITTIVKRHVLVRSEHIESSGSRTYDSPLSDEVFTPQKAIAAPPAPLVHYSNSESSSSSDSSYTSPKVNFKLPKEHNSSAARKLYEKTPFKHTKPTLKKRSPKETKRKPSNSRHGSESQTMNTIYTPPDSDQENEPFRANVPTASHSTEPTIKYDPSDRVHRDKKNKNITEVSPKITRKMKDTSSKSKKKAKDIISNELLEVSEPILKQGDSPTNNKSDLEMITNERRGKKESKSTKLQTKPEKRCEPPQQIIGKSKKHAKQSIDSGEQNDNPSATVLPSRADNMIIDSETVQPENKSTNNHSKPDNHSEPPQKMIEKSKKKLKQRVDSVAKNDNPTVLQSRADEVVIDSATDQLENKSRNIHSKPDKHSELPDQRIGKSKKRLKSIDSVAQNDVKTSRADEVVIDSATVQPEHKSSKTQSKPAKHSEPSHQKIGKSKKLMKTAADSVARDDTPAPPVLSSDANEVFIDSATTDTNVSKPKRRVRPKSIKTKSTTTTDSDTSKNTTSEKDNISIESLKKENSKKEKSKKLSKKESKSFEQSMGIIDLTMQELCLKSPTQDKATTENSDSRSRPRSRGQSNRLAKRDVAPGTPLRSCEKLPTELRRDSQIAMPPPVAVPDQHKELSSKTQKRKIQTTKPGTSKSSSHDPLSPKRPISVSPCRSDKTTSSCQPTAAKSAKTITVKKNKLRLKSPTSDRESGTSDSNLPKTPDTNQLSVINFSTTQNTLDSISCSTIMFSPNKNSTARTDDPCLRVTDRELYNRLNLTSNERSRLFRGRPSLTETKLPGNAVYTFVRKPDMANQFDSDDSDNDILDHMRGMVIAQRFEK